MGIGRTRARRTVAGVATLAALCTGSGVVAGAPATAATPPRHGMGALRSPGMTSAPTLGTTALSVVATTSVPVPASVDLSRFDPHVAD